MCYIEKSELEVRLLEALTAIFTVTAGPPTFLVHAQESLTSKTWYELPDWDQRKWHIGI